MAKNDERPQQECDGCGKLFTPKSSRQRFHSVGCREKTKKKAKKKVEAADADPQTRIVKWATTHGAPTRMLVGWDHETGYWDPASPIGQVLHDISKGTHVTVTARRHGFHDFNALLLRGAEYATSEDRQHIPIEVLPLVDLFSRVNYAESGAEIELSNATFDRAMLDGKLGLDFLGRRWPSRWREQQSISSMDEDDMRERAVSDLIADPTTAMQLAAMAATVEDTVEEAERSNA